MERVRLPKGTYSATVKNFELQSKWRTHSGFWVPPWDAGSDTIYLRDFSVQTSAWRIVAGKKIGILAVAAGVGRDTYDTRAQLGYVIHEEGTQRQTSGNFLFGQSVTPTNKFADVSLNLFLFRLVGEIGRVSATDVAGSVGIRIGR